DKNIKQGTMISDELIEAIKDLKFYIIVFSKNYASSSWCLEELVKTAYPVFYDVEPTEISKQSGAVGDVFATHKKEKAARKWSPVYTVDLFSKSNCMVNGYGGI
nr:Toll/interleukin-1 receptor (TIR) domain-containing protein [Tanacetum cinerariifolium]